ncbi:molybdenum cofactor guanylyltransferase [bacterium]|nr:molybdenum cofactor guanylyltransferase [bacterium]
MIDVEIQPYLIAGGNSVRMGADKRTLSIHGLPLLHHMITLCEKATGKIPHLVGDNYDNLPLPNLTILPDVEPGCGPMGGLVAALKHASKNEIKWIFVLAVDLPLLQVQDINKLLEAEKSSSEVICLKSRFSLQPLAALYSLTSIEYWHELLEKRHLSLVKGVKELNFQSIFPPSGEQALFNLNTPRDVAIVRSIIEEL